MDNREVILDIQDLHARFTPRMEWYMRSMELLYQVHAGETLGIVGGKRLWEERVHALRDGFTGCTTSRNSGRSDLIQRDDLRHYSKAEMRKVRGSNMTMIFQDPMTSLNPVLTVGFQIKEPLKLHMGMSDEEATKRAAELLELVNIPEAENRLSDYPHHSRAA